MKNSAARLYGIVAGDPKPQGIAPWVRATAGHRLARSLELAGNAEAAAATLE